jgi:hypothetical protein
MKANILMLIFSLFTCTALGQVEISGTVKTESGEPVQGANLFIEGTYDGCTSDTLGNFLFRTEATGEQTLIVRFVGYETERIQLNIDSDKSGLTFVMKESSSALEEVIINAGTFEASDKKKSVVMKPFDIASTAGATGDIYGTFGTLPGSHRVGEEGKLFVRGGEAYETKTYMDGMLVHTPYFSKMPDLPTRGRFSPLLFNGVVFSTGGYSAEFGQALSSVVALNTTALEPEDKSSISLLTVGIQGSHAERWENTSLAITAEYLHSGLTNRLFKQNVDWLKQPVNIGTTMMFRHKTSETGMIKSFGSFSYHTSSLRYFNPGELFWQDITLTNCNSYVNTTFHEMLSDQWMIHAGIALNIDAENTGLDEDDIETIRKNSHVKLTVTRLQSEKITIKGGIDYILNDYRQDISLDGSYSLGFTNNLYASFVESEVKINHFLAFRAGVRAEHHSLIRSTHVAPRMATAVKTGKSSQLSMAYGKFFQNPGEDYQKFSSALNPEKATHSILTWQVKKGSHTFRAEAYYKKYTGLVKFTEAYSFEPGNYTNNGSGYSQGIDLFWRNQRSIDKGDYWISYSWNDSKRNYRDFKEQATPHYVSEHTLTAVYKKFILKINTIASLTYSFASGRPYYNPNNREFMKDKTKPYNDFSIGLTHILYLFNRQSIIHLVVNNLFGFENIYGYTYSNTPDSHGIYQATPIIPASKRMAVLLVSIQL